MPNAPNRYCLLHLQCDDVTWAPGFLLYSIIDATGDNGLGEVIVKNKPALEDIELNHYISATRHANGRDWWIVVPRRKSNVYQLCLLTPDGVQYTGSQAIGSADTKYYAGQTAFSPDGSMYFKILPDGLRLMDFDRCVGLFSNFRFIPHLAPAGAGGLAVSAGGQYLYTTDGSHLYQFDLRAADIEASRQLVAEYDGYESPFPTAFYQGGLAPDGKIYFSTGSTNNVLHVIHQPDLPGGACQVEQHGLTLPALTGWFIPNFANYRLGPLDCSACDSLNLDNLPHSAWNVEVDTLDPLSAAFHDASSCTLGWRWDFGDNSAPDTVQHPVHTFPGPGAYLVCLTATNANGSDTRCDTVHIRTTAWDDPELQRRVQVWPNPFYGQLNVALSARIASPVFRLFDYLGHPLRSMPLPFGVSELNTEILPGGLYFWELRSRGELVKSGKLVKVR